MHLPAGITYWQKGTFRLYHHNPPLVKLVAALPVVWSGASDRAALRIEIWKTREPEQAPFAHLFAVANAARYFELFARARLVMPLFSVLGGLVVFAWSRRLYGNGGGLLSLSLWVFCPNILAHCAADHDRPGCDRDRRAGDVSVLAVPQEAKLARGARRGRLAWAWPSSRSSACSCSTWSGPSSG